MTEDTIETAALALVETSNQVAIRSDKDYIHAATMWSELRDMATSINLTFGPIIQKAHQAHKEAISQRDRYLKPVEAAAVHLKHVMGEYQTQKIKERQAEQRLLEAEARRQEEERLLQEAVAAEQEGFTQEAEAILAQPIEVAPPLVPAPVPRIEGGPVFREIWDAEVTDLGALVKAVCDGMAPLNLVMADQAALRKLAQALKGEMHIPGVRSYPRKV